MDHTFLSAFILLLLVLDPFGSLPIFISILGAVAPERRTFVAVREVLIAFAVLVLFMVSGQGFLTLMRLSERSLEVAGGVILIIIAIRMIRPFDRNRASVEFLEEIEDLIAHLRARQGRRAPRDERAALPRGHG